MRNLTDKTIKAATSGGKSSVYLADGGSLYLRVHLSGTKQWVYRLKQDAKTNWLDLGIYPDLSLADARLEAATLKAKQRKGVDIIQEIEAALAHTKAEQLKNNARITVSQLFVQFEKTTLIKRKDKGKEARRSFEKDVFPAIGDIPAADVTRAMVVKILDEVVARGAPMIARNLLGELRLMYDFAIERELVESDPTSRLKKKSFCVKKERERALTDDEVKSLTLKFSEARLSKSNIATLLIMLSTLCRVGEISKARWEHVDFEKRTWKIPAGNSKNGKAHVIFLSSFALNQFTLLKQLSGDSEWVLPARWTESHVCSKALAKIVGDRQRGDKLPMKCRSLHTNALALPNGKWTPHDLRRTGATIMGRIHVSSDVIEKCLNHKKKDKLERTYQRQELIDEQVEAWKRLGERLEQLTSTDISYCDMKLAA